MSSDNKILAHYSSFYECMSVLVGILKEEIACSLPDFYLLLLKPAVGVNMPAGIHTKLWHPFRTLGTLSYATKLLRNPHSLSGGRSQVFLVVTELLWVFASCPRIVAGQCPSSRPIVTHRCDDRGRTDGRLGRYVSVATCVRHMKPQGSENTFRIFTTVKGMHRISETYTRVAAILQMRATWPEHMLRTPTVLRLVAGSCPYTCF